MEIIVKAEQSQMLYDASCDIVTLSFIGNMSDDSYKEFWTKSIDFAEKHRINRIIIDQRQIGNVSFNARGWVVINAFPRVKRVLPNNLAAAVLASDKIMQKTGMQYLLKAFRTLTGYRVEIFPNHEEAIAFLIKANKSFKQPA